MKNLVLALLLLAAAPSPQVLDDFKDISRWKVLPSDGIAASISPAEGGLRLDYDFQGRGGYAVVRREIPLDLPENYEFTFRIRGEGLPNTLEFKLVDPTKENVWWVTRRDFEPPREWTEIRFKKRHIQFAWGPKGGGEIRRVAAIELTVTASRGGKGYVIFDDLTLTERPTDRPYDRTPRIIAAAQSFIIDFLERREYGGLVIDWEPSRFASRYDVQISDDRQNWKTLRTVENGNGGRDYLYLPETDSRYLRLRYHEGSGTPEVTVQPLEFSASKNAFFERIAKDAPRGRYPRATTGEQVYWTVVGVDGDTAEGLLSEDGALETGKNGFSIEPFLFLNGKLLTWADVRASQSLAGGYLPIPSVLWEGAPVSLKITAFASGEPGSAALHARYRVKNLGDKEIHPRLFLAVRPFQVNPPYQFLNTPGGAATIREIAWDGRAVSVDGRTVLPSEKPSGFGAATFDEGDITDSLVRGELPAKNKVNDSFGHASAALAWDLRLAPGEERDVHVSIPLHEEMTEGDLATVEKEWRKKLDRVGFRLPASVAPWAETLRSNLAYLLINRDGPGIQPGSRSYERSWIRDGALSSSAMLRLGHADAAREFLVWYAGHQFPNGKVPCCVDARGADPVPENDSHGEFIHLVAEYFRYTGDRELLASLWPNVQNAMRFMEELRQQRRTNEYRQPDKLAYFGLLPESISHEGYSDRPVHSYWDDFWGMLGYKDAVEIARALGKNEEATRWAAWRDEFQTDLHTSLRRTIAMHKIDYIPGSVEKGDFDATSTSIGVAPAGEMARLPKTELLQTFERYWQEVQTRRTSDSWEAYTPYELRNSRTLLRLGQPERARELLALQFEDRRPAAWNHWAEVVRREVRKGHFLGDMPHTWVGAEFIHSFLDLFAYASDDGRSLILGAGLDPEWPRGDGVAIENLRTEFGLLSYSARMEEGGVRYRISGELRMPPGGIIARWRDKEIVVREVPAEVVVRQ